jgi:RNA polymerase sigma-70 factor, ECF subfamily
MEIKNIHTEFHEALLGYISSRISNKSDAEDILQEVFIKIAKSINTLSDEQKLKSWIFTITRNTITDYYRNNAGNSNISITENMIDETKEELTVDSTKGLDKCLAGFIQQLPDEYRDIIIDSELNEVKQKDLAIKYNMQYPTVRSRVQRGRARLKELLLGCCAVETDSRGNIVQSTLIGNCGDVCGNCN